MKKILHTLVFTLMLAVINILPLGTHTAVAAPLHAEYSHNTSHTSNSAICSTACVTATQQKSNIIKETDQDDDEPQPPFYAKSQSDHVANLQVEHSQKTKLSIASDIPPDSVPTYIKLAVSRT
ncbi:MAG TPA: hypothetical protein PLZ58_03725 [Candidatus Saccharibacteria bacterium]|nr:hypothetical protein [Candidatus Saccharibacteria bacterium]HRQ06816.1 hypothetical protein [Candidatus Saccharibacteria bacterium]